MADRVRERVTEEPVMMLHGGPLVRVFIGPGYECAHCGAPAAWSYFRRIANVEHADGPHCTILCWERGDRERTQVLEDEAGTEPAPALNPGDPQG